MRGGRRKFKSFTEQSEEEEVDRGVLCFYFLWPSSWLVTINHLLLRTHDEKRWSPARLDACAKVPFCLVLSWRGRFSPYVMRIAEDCHHERPENNNIDGGTGFEDSGFSLTVFLQEERRTSE